MSISSAERRHRKFRVRKKNLEFLGTVVGAVPSELSRRSLISGDIHIFAGDLRNCRYYAKCVEFRSKRYNYQAEDRVA